MFNVAQFLEKFKQFNSNALVIREAVKEVVSQELHISIPEKDIQVKEGIARIQANPMLKNTLYIKKEAILASLRAKGIKITDIK